MNKNFIIFNLEQAKASLNNLIDELNKPEEFYSTEFYSYLTTIYAYINTSWNAKESSTEEAQKYTKENFKKWSQFPEDIDMIEFT